jgi:kumamolisin
LFCALLWAGLIALNNAQNKTTAGFLQPAIYAAKAKSAFNDITAGNNGGFTAGPGWDACTGLGSPVGTSLIALLGGASASVAKGSSKKPPAKKSAPAKKHAIKKHAVKKHVVKAPALRRAVAKSAAKKKKR